METKVEKISNCKRKLTIKVPKDVTQQDYKSVLQHYQSNAPMQGFRKGKAPLSMIEKAYKDQIKIDYLEEYIPKYYYNALQELSKEDTHPITHGKLEDFKWEPGTPLTLSFNFEVKPSIEIKNYKGFEIPFTPKKVTKELIAQELKRLQEHYATVEEKDDGVIAKKDVIYYTITSYYGQPVEKQDEQSYQVGSKVLGEIFDKDIIGKKKGDTVNTVLEIKSADDEEKPQSHPVSIKITSVKKVMLPQLDDDFAKDIGDYSSLKYLKAAIKENLEKEFEEQNREEKRSLILREIIKQNPFELPEDFVKEYVDDVIAQTAQKNKNMSENDLKEFKESYKEYVRDQLKITYILEKLRELEKVEVTNEEIEQEIAKSAQKMNMDVEKYKELYKKQIDSNMIKQNIANDKVLDKIAESVKFVKNKKGEVK
jgi:trigger factor